MKQMSPDIKLIILVNMNAKLFSWTFTYSQGSAATDLKEVLVLIQASSVDPFWT